MLFQCVLTGKAQEVYSSLSLEQSAVYDTVKTSILHAYKLVLEAYCQHFRNYSKSDKQTFVEFAREKENIFVRWCASKQVETKEQLRDLILLEEFKNCIPEVLAICTCLNRRFPNCLMQLLWLMSLLLLIKGYMKTVTYEEMIRVVVNLLWQDLTLFQLHLVSLMLFLLR